MARRSNNKETNKIQGNSAIENFSELSRWPVRVDLHTHSVTSSDGNHPISYLMWEAMRKGIGALAVTDHNNVSGVRQYFIDRGEPTNSVYFKEKDTYFIPGVEITCRVNDIPNLKGNSTKVHLLCYGCDWSKDSPISQLLDIKAENDRLVDFGRLEYVLKKKGLDDLVTDNMIHEFMRRKRSEVSGFSTLGTDAIAEFIAFLTEIDKKTLGKLGLPEKRGDEIRKRIIENGVSFKSNRSLDALLEGAPNVERLNLSFEDVIKIVHASGGVVVMAHPGVNLKRTNYQEELVGTLIDNRVDGFEIGAETKDSNLRSMITGVLKSKGKLNRAIITAGSDTHYIDQKDAQNNTLGEYKNRTIHSSTLSNFFGTLESIAQARREGVLTYAEYPPVDAQAIIEDYRTKAEACKRVRKGINFEERKARGADTIRAIKSRRRGERNRRKSTSHQSDEKDYILLYPKSGTPVKIPQYYSLEDINAQNDEVFAREEYEALLECFYSDNGDGRDFSILERVGLLHYKDKTNEIDGM